ncbi:MAG: glycogen synthase GlgA [Acidobacteria bacterium]|nr:glycogen synthase GlgA [Acidobacteriota bacterium]
MQKKLRVLIAAAEASPFAKEGGLADVVGGLAHALSELDVDVRVMLPRYGSLKDTKRLRPKAELGRISLEVYSFQAHLLQAEFPASAVPVYFVENSDFFGGPGIYSDPGSGEALADNFQRFLFFMKAALAACRRMAWIPDVIHCNDWHTGLLPAYLKLGYDAADWPFRSTASVFTIHNLAYQGRVSMDLFKLTDLPRHLAYPQGPFESDGDLNLMKSAIVFADVLTTVSPTYALEIQRSLEYGYGLEALLRSRHRDLYGVLNGIDTDEWNPATDRLISARYSVKRFEGKARNKAELQRSLGLRESSVIPLVGMISRLAEQKGLDLVLQAIPQLLAMDLQFVFLGSGNKKYYEALQFVARNHPQKFSVNLKFDNKLAHWIEAGSDLFLMPSRYEPCGLNQMYSLRYGTIPVVHHTGGLADTVRDCHQYPDGNGFKFYTYSAGEMLETLRRALFVYQDRREWRKVMKRGMTEDFSWRKSAQRYYELYQVARAKV